MAKATNTPKVDSSAKRRPGRPSGKVSKPTTPSTVGRASKRAAETSAKKAATPVPQKKESKTATAPGSSGEKVRVWWPPTKNKKKTDFSGMYWPAQVLKKSGDTYEVQYDNGDKEAVDAENVSPANPPVGFGKESVPVQVGEFLEVFNNSTSDPAYWVCRLKKVNKVTFTVSYPFHDAPDETVKPELVRRARVFDDRSKKWMLVQPKQDWQDGEVASPLELELCTEKELFAALNDKTPPPAAEAPQGKTPKKAAEKADTPAMKKTPTAARKQATPAEPPAKKAEAPAKTPAKAAAETKAADKAAGATPTPAKRGPGRPPKNAAASPATAAAAPPESAISSPTPTKKAKTSSASDAKPAPSASAAPVASDAAAAGPSDTSAGVPAAEGEGKTKKRKKKGNERLPKPKPARSAYTYYAIKHREEIKAEHPEATTQEMTKLVAERWAKVTEAEKAELNVLVAQDKERYAKDFEEYKTKLAALPPLESEESEPEEGKKKKKRDPDEPRRPRSSYILFSMEYRKSLDPAVAFNDGTKLAAEAWRKAGPEDKAKFDKEAEAEKAEYDKVLAAYKAKKAEQEAARAAAEPNMSSAAAAGPSDPTDVSAALNSLDLDKARKEIKKAGYTEELYYLLVDAWRKESKRVDDALRAQRTFLVNSKKPDWKGFLVATFGLDIVNKQKKPTEEAAAEAT